MWYIFDKSNNCMAVCDYEPDKDDLGSRGELSVESDQILPINQVTKDEKGKVIRKPIAELSAEEFKQQKLAALDTEYRPQFSALVHSLGLATLNGNQVVIDGIKSDYVTLRAEYQIKLDEVAVNATAAKTPGE